MSETFLQNKVIDLVGIGNSIVDIITNVDDEFLKENLLEKGSMNLISLEDSNKILKKCKIIKQISGGSAANTVVSLANLKNNVEFIGLIKDDEFGNFFVKDIKESGAKFNSKAIKTNNSSAHSIILITPDAQRTMCTYLGASNQFEPNNINYNSIKNSKYLYLEGYLWDSDLAKKAFIQAAQTAKDSNTKIILSLSDSFCVDRHRESFIHLIEDFVDILFCNEAEIKSLFKEVDLQNCKTGIQSICELTVITLGEKGSLLIDKSNTEFIKPVILGEVIDTTGAGDIFAGGFIHGLINNYSLNSCGKLGSICAGHIVTQIGSRPQTNLKDLISKYIN
tara:strand:- start:1090 stop:2097 length:1008 start_codon:yes stop_codon:yes gene_type:complete